MSPISDAPFPVEDPRFRGREKEIWTEDAEATCMLRYDMVLLCVQLKRPGKVYL
jgi:hypothetical protein